MDNWVPLLVQIVVTAGVVYGIYVSRQKTKAEADQTNASAADQLVNTSVRTVEFLEQVYEAKFAEQNQRIHVLEEQNRDLVATVARLEQQVKDSDNWRREIADYQMKLGACLQRSETLEQQAEDLKREISRLRGDG